MQFKIKEGDVDFDYDSSRYREWSGEGHTMIIRTWKDGEPIEVGMDMHDFVQAAKKMIAIWEM